MKTDELRQLLLELAHQHPDAHPYTLALKLQHRTGRIMTGAWARQQLEQARESGELKGPSPQGRP